MQRSTASTFLLIHMSAIVVMGVLLLATALIECLFLTRRLFVATERSGRSLRPLPAPLGRRSLQAG